MGNSSGKTQKHHKDNKRHFKSYKLRYNTSNYHKKNSMRNYMRKRNNHTHRRGGVGKDKPYLLRKVLVSERDKRVEKEEKEKEKENVKELIRINEENKHNYEHSPTKSRYGFANEKK